MNRHALTAFHQLMKRGFIDRRENADAWEAERDTEAWNELEELGAELGFVLYRSGNRIYLIPTQENDLFLKNNADYRKDIKADKEIRLRDLYLLNYLAIYLLFLFFKGEGANPQTREFITKEDFLSVFSEHCQSVADSVKEDLIPQTEYGENFLQLAEMWLAKTEGEPDTQKIAARYGCLNKILLKFRTDGLFETDSDRKIRPTRKLCDLMPYFLRKDRVADIHKWLAQSEK